MTHSIKRILCSIGLRGNCDKVIEESITLALATGADIHILHVVKSLPDEVMSTLRSNIRSPKTVSSLIMERTEQWRNELAGRLDAFWGRFPELQEAMGEREITLSVQEGYPAAVICNFANRGGFDLIVMAANKKTYVSTYAGKVTKGVIQRSKVPVVVVPTAC